MVDERELRAWFSNAQRVLIAGIGNPIRMDDFVGVKVVRELRNKVPSNVHLIECETVPEGFAHEIVEFNPTHILLIDAAMLGAKAGQVMLFPPEKLEFFPVVSSHVLPLRIFCDFLKENTKAKIALLLIQPEKVGFGEHMSHVVEVSAKKIVKFLLKILAHL
ncbi:MAG: hydrogenase 3 maturation endopeptidase HyCI [Candidatus Bathyarchaeales archaeon]